MTDKELMLEFIKYQNEQSQKNQAAVQEAFMAQKAKKTEVQHKRSSNIWLRR